jgi:hypothetical protein
VLQAWLLSCVGECKRTVTRHLLSLLQPAQQTAQWVGKFVTSHMQLCEHQPSLLKPCAQQRHRLQQQLLLFVQLGSYSLMAPQPQRLPRL